MTVGQLQQILDSIDDKNTNVVIYDPGHHAQWRSNTGADLMDLLYIGGAKYTIPNYKRFPWSKAPKGEIEKVLIIQGRGISWGGYKGAAPPKLSI